jgi:hypothetical protein
VCVGGGGGGGGGGGSGGSGPAAKRTKRGKTNGNDAGGIKTHETSATNGHVTQIPANLPSGNQPLQRVTRAKTAQRAAEEAAQRAAEEAAQREAAANQRPRRNTRKPDRLRAGEDAYDAPNWAAYAGLPML